MRLLSCKTGKTTGKNCALGRSQKLQGRAGLHEFKLVMGRYSSSNSMLIKLVIEHAALIKHNVFEMRVCKVPKKCSCTEYCEKASAITTEVSKTLCLTQFLATLSAAACRPFKVYNFSFIFCILYSLNSNNVQILDKCLNYFLI